VLKDRLLMLKTGRIYECKLSTSAQISFQLIVALFLQIAARSIAADFYIWPPVLPIEASGGITEFMNNHQDGMFHRGYSPRSILQITQPFTTISDLSIFSGWYRSCSSAAIGDGTVNSIETRSVTISRYPQDMKGDSSFLPCAGNNNVKLIVRDSYLPGIPVLVRIEAINDDGTVNRDLWDATAGLSVADNPDIGLSTNQVSLYNGIGSALVTFTGGGSFTLTAGINGHEVDKIIADWSYRPVRKVSGRLGRSQTWNGIYRIVGGDFKIPERVVLTLAPGTIVLIDGVPSGSGGTDIDVEGSIQSLGTAASPVTITAYQAAWNWGELRHENADLSVFRYTHITQAGHSPPVGHSNSGPAIRASNSSLIFDHASLTDNAGKIMHVTSGSDLAFYRCLLERSVMGPEISRTALWFENSWIMDMHAGDDADGIYIHGQQSGQQCTLSRCVAANIDDDGIDTLNSQVTIRDCIVRDCKDKAVVCTAAE